MGETLFQLEFNDLRFAINVSKGIAGQPAVGPTNCGPASAWLLGIITYEEAVAMTQAHRGYTTDFWIAALDRRYPMFSHRILAAYLTAETIVHVSRYLAPGRATLAVSYPTANPFGHYFVLSKSDQGVLQLYDAQRNYQVRGETEIFNFIRGMHDMAAPGQNLAMTTFVQTPRPGAVIPPPAAEAAAPPYGLGKAARVEQKAAREQAAAAVGAVTAGPQVFASLDDIPEPPPVGLIPQMPAPAGPPPPMDVENGGRRRRITRRRSSLPKRRVGRSSSSKRKRYSRRQRA